MEGRDGKIWIMFLKVVVYGPSAAMSVERAKKLAVQITPSQKQCMNAWNCQARSDSVNKHLIVPWYCLWKSSQNSSLFGQEHSVLHTKGHYN